MKLHFCKVFLIVFAFPLGLSAQKQVTISGYVKDATSGEALIGASVYVKETMRGTATNVYGYYVLNVDPGTHTVALSYIGYDEFSKSVTLTADLKLNIEARPKAIL
ncbi:MAG TPA: carboxypeptidase-like regulatory domain-containing protein, partial [Flavobacteriales bacterium]|nr:carboxypeptidase-like regulatory domain-containing protein [Flavobacteriales bacterium]